jgi:hypothetical protein
MTHDPVSSNAESVLRFGVIAMHYQFVFDITNATNG